MKHLRTKLLNIAFNLLYSRFVFFHELAGRVLYGAAWHGRRIGCLELLDGYAALVDVGAGEGRLVQAASRRMIDLRGIEPSPAMRKSALSRGVWLARGESYSLPMPDRSAGAIVVTYPGRWIVAEDAWREFRRVLKDPAAVVILLGGTYERGPWAWLRGVLTRIAYGQGNAQSFDVPATRDAGMHIWIETLDDQWGRFFVLRARTD